MKQKYVLLLDNDKNDLIIQEFAELDKDILTFLCEERYPISKIEDAIQKGKDALVAALRTENLYPPILFAEKIAAKVEGLILSRDGQPHEILFDDNDYILKNQVRPVPEEEIEEETEDLDELIDADIEDDYEDKLNSFNPSIQIADDETLDIDEEN